MKFTPEQVIEMAREAGFPSMSLDNISDTDAERLARLCTFAADAALEEAAHDADTNGVDGIPINGDDVVADWLRAMKEQA